MLVLDILKKQRKYILQPLKETNKKSVLGAKPRLCVTLETK